MKRTVALTIAVILVVWLSAALVRAENERYALTVGMCRAAAGQVDLECLRKVQTRTGWWWHLFYALTRWE